MRTHDGWVIPMTTTVLEDLAWSLAWLAGEGGLTAVTIRALARHARLSPGTISNHFSSKQELWARSAGVIARWLAHATSDHVQDRGAVGLFPAREDQTYRLLVSGWAQLRAHALTEPEMDRRIAGDQTMLERSAQGALSVDRSWSVPAWICLEGLRLELVRPGSTLTPDDALALLQQVEPDATQGPAIFA
jgi:AcrR family transcriptional regulator